MDKPPPRCPGATLTTTLLFCNARYPSNGCRLTREPLLKSTGFCLVAEWRSGPLSASVVTPEQQAVDETSKTLKQVEVSLEVARAQAALYQQMSDDLTAGGLQLPESYGERLGELHG